MTVPTPADEDDEQTQTNDDDVLSHDELLAVERRARARALVDAFLGDVEKSVDAARQRGDDR